MARIAIKSNADRQFILCRDDRGFFLQTIHSDEKKRIEERAVTIGEAKQFYDRAPEKAKRFAVTVPQFKKEYVPIAPMGCETQRSIERREQYELQPI
jgi:hypothetical protein